MFLWGEMDGGADGEAEEGVCAVGVDCLEFPADSCGESSELISMFYKTMLHTAGEEGGVNRRER